MPRSVRDRALELANALRSPMAVDPRWLEEAVAALISRDAARLEALTLGFGSAVTRAEIVDNVARIEIRGPLIEGFLFTDYSDIRAAVEELAPQAEGVLLDIDSPGGVVAGPLWDLAAALRAVRDETPIVAVANDQATSAAYVIASQASEVMAGGRSAVLGSLGVIATHRDLSEANRQRGLRVTEVVSGRLKNALSPNRALSREGLRLLEDLVASAFAEMIDAVTEGREALSESDIRSQEGGIFLGPDAVERRLADGIESVDEIAARLGRGRSSPERARAAMGGVVVPQDNRTQPGAQPRSDAPSTQAEPTAPAPAASQPTPSAAAQPEGGQVVSIETARSEGERAAREAERARAQSVLQACQLAGCPERAGELIAEGLTGVEAGQRILDDRAANAGPEIRSQHADAGGEAEPEIHADAVYAKWNDPAAFASRTTDGRVRA